MGKGSGRRPTLVGEETFEDNWRRTFAPPKIEPLVVTDECTEFDDADDVARMAAARALNEELEEIEARKGNPAFCIESPDGHHNPEDVCGPWHWCTWCSSEVEYKGGRWREVDAAE